MQGAPQFQNFGVCHKPRACLADSDAGAAAQTSHFVGFHGIVDQFDGAGGTGSDAISAQNAFVSFGLRGDQSWLDSVAVRNISRHSQLLGLVGTILDVEHFFPHAFPKVLRLFQV